MRNYYNETAERGSPTAETPRQTIRRVRNASSYGALRAVIGFLVAPGYLIGLIGIFGSVTNRIDGVSTALGVAISVAILLVTLAVHQALRLLVDIADMMIENVRKK